MADTVPVLDRASAIAERAELEPESMAMLTSEESSLDYMGRLVEAGLLEDALRFAAFALPKPVAVAWACHCVRTAVPAPSRDQDREALAVAERWVEEPREERRAEALAAAEEAGYDGPWGWVAAAVAWNSGSLAPAGLPVVEPPDDLTAKAVFAALMTGAALAEAADVPQRQKGFVDLGMTILREIG